MEHFIVSARKYRPQSFKDVVGQQAITNTLSNAIKHNHLAQALLFTGPRGVGKTTCARILAKMINQDGTQSPDEDFAFNIFELDAASNNSVDDIRNLIDQVRIPPQVGKYKVYIIDEVHMLSQSAFNAFLKTLEEPPKHAIFILATTEKHKIIPTILSRCQIFDFKRITVSDARTYLGYIAEQEGVKVEEDALHIIAQKADGAMRDALSIYDRVVSFSGNNLTRQAVTENLNVLDYDTYINITHLILENDIPKLLVAYNDILSSGFDGHHFISGLASHLRDLLVCKDQKTIVLLEVSEQTKTRYFEQSQKTSYEFLLKAIDLANECSLKYKSSHNQRLLVELCLMQLASIDFDREKKKSEGFIIPAQNFKSAENEVLILSSEEKRVVKENEYGQHSPLPSKETQLPSDNTKTNDKCIKGENEEYFSDASPGKELASDLNSLAAEERQSENLNTEVRKFPSEHLPPFNEQIKREKTSGLSLKSIQKKKEIIAKKLEQSPATPEDIDEPFNEIQLHAAWDDYVQRLNKKGSKILASILETDTPKLEGKTVLVEMPNDTMKLDLEKGQNQLLAFLKQKLKNSHINLEITVNESTAKKYAFTPIEKYNKLKEKNPLIEKLRNTFDLDV